VIPHQEPQIAQQTSSYWSVPEQTDFPTLLRHFGSDRHRIARWMTSKTHIMVYSIVFFLFSQGITNILKVKNYYQRQVDSGNTGS
jgi:hypothetical protein